MQILVIEDDRWIAASIGRELSRTHSVDIRHGGRDGLYAAQVTDYALITLDVGLPDLSGLEVCTQLRKNGVRCPVLMHTASESAADTVAALENGADDYLVKPFRFPVLQARIAALLRRGADVRATPVLNCDDLEVDTRSRTVRRRGAIIPLRRKEHDLLELLVRHQGEVVSRAAMLSHAWDTEADLLTNAIDVHIKHLRDKIDRPFGSRLIHTVYGYGYRLGKEVGTP